MDMSCLVWLVTFVNSVRTGTIATKTGGGYGVVLVTLLPATCGWLTASTSIRIIGVTTSGFDVCQDPINTEPHKAWSSNGGFRILAKLINSK